MNIKETLTGKKASIIQMALMTIGFGNLLKMSSGYIDYMTCGEDFSNYFISYLVSYGIGITALIYNNRHNTFRTDDKFNRKAILVFSILFTMIITGANYALTSLPNPENAGYVFRHLHRYIYVISVMAGSFTASYNIFCCLGHHVCNRDHKIGTESNSRKVYVFTFLLVAIVDASVMILCKWPGNVLTDSFAQIYQATGDFGYSNHHPFYHTLVIKLFMTIGMGLFGKYNFAVAAYNLFQILFMAACFAYGVKLLADMRVPKWIVYSISAIYIVMPYHIMYSFTMTKDVMFGGFMLVMIVSLYRYRNRIGKDASNIIITAVSGLGLCLFRSNGMFIYALWIAGIMIILRNELKEGWIKDRIRDRSVRLITCMIIVVIAGFIMKGPVLKALGINQTDMVESLSIPIQQMSRVAVDADDYSDDDRNLIGNVVNIDRVKDVYCNTLSDPEKNLIRDEGNEEYLSGHMGDFLKLYIKTGLRHPYIYMKAWIDQTCGFWNAGYKGLYWYDVVESGIFDNRYDIHRTVICRQLNTMVDEYLTLFEEVPVLQLFLSIGFNFWLVLAVLFVAVIRRDREGIIISLPVILLVISLMVATPVSMEFRYAYAMLCCLPLIIFVVSWRLTESNCMND